LDHTFSTAGWSSAVTWRQALDRSAATTADKASFGSIFIRDTSLQQPHPAGQLRLHVQHRLVQVCIVISDLFALGRPDTIAPAEPGHRVEVGQHSLARG